MKGKERERERERERWVGVFVVQEWEIGVRDEKG